MYGAGLLLALIIPVPSSLRSMSIFFILLQTGVLKEERFKSISTLVLGNLAFFFIPPCLKIINSFHLLEGITFKILLALTVSNISVLVVTGLVVQFVLKREEAND